MSTPSVKKVLIIGSGPITIGQTVAYDEAACRACEVFRKAGFQTILVHCDPSAMAADVDTADRTYLVPLTVESLTKVILRVKPDAILPTVGGPRALDLVKVFVQNGLLKEKNIHLMGISEKAVRLINDPTAFFNAVSDLGFDTPHGLSVSGVADAAAAAETIGYPVFARSAESAGSRRYGIVYNVEELRSLIAGGRLPSNKKDIFRIEKALSGYHEIEVELLRDSKNRIQMVGVAENIEPVGIHSGDSTSVILPVSMDDPVYQQIEKASFNLAEKMEVRGAIHIKFAVAANRKKVLVLSMDTCFSRMTGFFSKTTGISLSTGHAKLALGMSMSDALDVKAPTGSSLIPDRIVAVRLPRWEFERFPGEEEKLDTRLKSTGAVMGIGRNFLEAFQKALRARSPRNPVMGLQKDMVSASMDTLMRRLVSPSPKWLYIVHEALKKGAVPEDVALSTGISVQWIRQFVDLGRLENQLMKEKGGTLSPLLLKEAASMGFSATELSLLAGISEKTAEGLFEDADVKIGPCSPSEQDTQKSSILFNTPVDNHSKYSPTGKTILIVGPGPSRIGQGIEMDHCCTVGGKAINSAGHQVALVNSNPGSACGFNHFSRIYVEPLTCSDIKKVCNAENPNGVILQFGGYRAMEMANDLAKAGFSILGTPHEQVSLTQNRIEFNKLLKDLGIVHTQMGIADNPEQALDMAESIGYPLMARPQRSNPWKQRSIIMEPRMMENYVKSVDISHNSPILLEQFLEYAIEVEADALCDGQTVYVPAVMEHIELAGVHSGDAALVIPPYSTPPRHVETINAYIQKVALKLGVKGVLNTRFAVYNDTVYFLEARPWACRTLPMVSKVCNISMAERAVEIMLGLTMDEMDLPRRLLPYYGIRSSVFPFDTFTKTDPLLGLRMRSTGQSMVLSEVFGMAYFSSQDAAGPTLPISGDVLITVTDKDKPSILEPARLYSEMGFGIQATRGTNAFLKKNGIYSKLVKKVGFGRPDLVDGIKTGEVALVVNTPSSRQSHQDDAYIRNTAIRYGIPNITTPAGALASAKGIAARKMSQDALCTLQSYVRAIR